MDLQSYLITKFEGWRPPPPIVEGRSKCDVTLRWETRPFDFLQGELLFWVQKNQKIPSWVIVYSGGKNTKVIDNLPPRFPHKFRFKVILKATAVPTLAAKAIQFFGDDKTAYEYLEEYRETEIYTKDNQVVEKVKLHESGANEVLDNDKNCKITVQTSVTETGEGDHNSVTEKDRNIINKHAGSSDIDNYSNFQVIPKSEVPVGKKWLESQWSHETSTSTDTDGSSAVCFCMAVRCGYLKQVQVMLEERPALIEIINSNNGFTPLATAVRKGDITTVKFVIAAGADVNQPSTSGQTPLHLATLGARVALVDLLLDKGADFQARDLNGLRIEHYAVDSGSQEMMTFVLQRGGDVLARDCNGWTPLFRAVTQGASTSLIELLVAAGSDVDAADYAGLALISAARLLSNRFGRGRDSVLRLVDSQYPHEKAVANFTRLTKKISSLHTILK